MGEDHSKPVIKTENKINCFCLSDTSLVYQEVNQMLPWLKYHFKVEREKNRTIENEWAIINYLSNCTIDNIYKTIVSHYYEISSNLYSHNNILLWIHGHVHNNCSYFIDKTPVVCNPLGYVRFGEMSGFLNNAILEF